MTFFNSLNEVIQIIFIVLCVLAFVSMIFLVCLCAGRKKNGILAVSTSVVALLSAFNVIRLVYGAPIFGSNSVSDILNSDMGVIVAIAVNISLGTIALILSLSERQRPFISASKLPDYLELSKDAVLFADKKGQVVIANKKMKELCRTITRAPLKNANDFCDTVFSFRNNGKITVFNVGNKRIFRLPDTSAWEFSHIDLDDGNYLITACDTTQSLNTAEKITENKRLIKEAENRLQWTLDNLDGLKKQAEISEKNAPIRSQIREYSNSLYESISNNEGITPMQIGSDLIPDEQKLPLIISAFELVGVTIRIIGNMAPDSPLFSVLFELLCTSASNAVSLCRAESITMAIYEGGNRLTANITCDGAALQDSKAGVFDDIKKRITSLGGTFTMVQEPTLKLSVMLSK